MPDTEEIRRAMQAFVDERLRVKVSELKPSQDDKRAELVEQHRFEAWLQSAAVRVSQLQLVTHTEKQMHPQARGTRLHVTPRAPQAQALDARGLVGTHSLSSGRTTDVVGNSGALDVCKFLHIECDGVSLLGLALTRDAMFKKALSDDPETADDLCEAFAGITESKVTPRSHTLAKQLYFPVGDDGEYHILAPLFPTTLVHRLRETINQHRFGDEAKAAREARREDTCSAESIHEYPGLAIQNFGGSNPQTISYLNAKRRGENYLLASLPPGMPASRRPAWGLKSIMDGGFKNTSAVRGLVDAIKSDLKTQNLSVPQVLRKVRSRVAGIVDELIFYAASLQALRSGWSQEEGCVLDDSEKRWLDPDADRGDATCVGWPSDISKRLEKWVSRRFSAERAEMRSEEAAIWAALLSDEISAFRVQLELPHD